MSAHDKFARARRAAGMVDESAQPTSAANEAYYELLVDRLETLLLDMKNSGTGAEDPLYVRLNDLLNETRELLRNARSINDSAASVLGR